MLNGGRLVNMPSSSSLCIKVPKAHGEDFRRLALRYNLLDTSRKPKATNFHIMIPISRAPNEVEATALQRIGIYEIKACALSPARPHPKSLAELLAETIPPPLLGDLPKSYDMVGDIIVIEDLSESLRLYEGAIGSAFLRLYPGAVTCLLKIGKVEGERRVPTYRLLAGVDKTDTVYKEHGLRLKIDLAKAYFSPRLAYERQRIASMVKEGETVVDMFAGVGPFSLNIAKKVRAKVHSIDINPDAIALLFENISLNRLKGDVCPVCGDAVKVSKELTGVADRVIMNLPGSSVDFLETAVALLKPRGGIIHIYFFLADSDIENAASFIGTPMMRCCSEVGIQGLRSVKEVAPKKWQYVADVACKPKVPSARG